MSFDFDVGARLKEVRSKRGLSQRELAKRASVTNSTISLIEQNRVSPSVASLKKVLDGLPMSMEAFFASDEPQQQQVFYRASELPDLGQGCVVKRLVGYNHEQRAISLLHETYPSACDTGPAMTVAEADQAGILITGELEVTVNGQVRTLTEGDAYYITATQPYRIRNISNRPCIVVTGNSGLKF